MSSFDWESFLKRWSQEIIDSIGNDQKDLPPEVLRSGWLGYPGASEKQIARAEARLETSLPPSYKAFLRVTNGWRPTSVFSNRLLSLEEIEWFAVKNQAWINTFWEKAEKPPSESSNAKAPLPSIPDSDYFVYGDDQDCSKIRVEYLQTALEISNRGDGAIYLLNPQIVTPEGEWEAWFFGDWLPGADRYRSFQDMMQTEYENFLELRETPVISGSPAPKAEPEGANAPPTVMEAAASVSVVAPESDRLQVDASSVSASAMTENWHDLASFTIEFQTGQRQRKQRSIVRHQETGAVETFSDMDPAAIQQWMLTQLNRHPDQAQVEEPIGLEITQLRVIRAPQTERPMVANQAQPLFVNAIQRGEPFALEVSIQVVDSGQSSLAERQLVYRAHCVAHHLSTRLDTDLGDITTHIASSRQSTYTTQFPQVRLQQPGLYRLKIWVTLQNVSASPGYFKVPMLQVV